MALPRVAVLASGSGSNLQALLNATATGNCAAEISLVISNNPGVYALSRAAKAGVEAIVLNHRDFAERPDFEAAVDRNLRNRQIDFVCLAGFMRILSRTFVESWRDRMLNIHPSLLPSFKGTNTHKRALAAGVRVSGCTVHFVRAELDDGPIIVQGIVPLKLEDTHSELAARVLEMEHECYPQALDLLARGQIVVRKEQVEFLRPTKSLFIHPLLGENAN